MLPPTCIELTSFFCPLPILPVLVNRMDPLPPSVEISLRGEDANLGVHAHLRRFFDFFHKIAFFRCSIFTCTVEGAPSEGMYIAREGGNIATFLVYISPTTNGSPKSDASTVSIAVATSKSKAATAQVTMAAASSVVPNP